MSTLDLSIVICACDEEESLSILIPELQATLRELGKTFEVIVVDDCSTDDTARVVREQQRLFPELELVQLPERGGQTGCFEAAFKVVRGEYTIRMDADLQDVPADLPQFIRKLDSGYQLVMGLREYRKHRRLFRFASFVYDRIIILLFDTPLRATSGSFVGFKTDLIKNIPFHKNDHRYLPLIAIRRGADPVGDVAVRHRSRQFGVSKYKPVQKLALGTPELLMLLVRIYRGVYGPARPESSTPKEVVDHVPHTSQQPR
jgi:glycosyltransferase involved in cell wall biosynthesis